MKKLFFFLFSLLLLSGCGSTFQLVNSEIYNNADLAAYKTFRIISPNNGSLPNLMNMVQYSTIANDIKQQMQMRGYTESSSSDLVINIGITTQKHIETESALPPGYWSYGGYWHWWASPREMYWQNYYQNAQLITAIYKEGVLTMDFINIKTKMFLYSASVSTILENGNSALRNVNELNQAVQVLFSKFPIKPIGTMNNK